MLFRLCCIATVFTLLPVTAFIIAKTAVVIFVVAIIFIATLRTLLIVIAFAFIVDIIAIAIFAIFYTISYRFFTNRAYEVMCTVSIACVGCVIVSAVEWDYYTLITCISSNIIAVIIFVNNYIAIIVIANIAFT